MTRQITNSSPTARELEIARRSAERHVAAIRYSGMPAEQRAAREALHAAERACEAARAAESA